MLIGAGLWSWAWGEVANDEIKRVVNEGITNRGIAGIILDFSLVNGIDR